MNRKKPAGSVVSFAAGMLSTLLLVAFYAYSTREIPLLRAPDPDRIPDPDPAAPPAPPPASKSGCAPGTECIVLTINGGHSGGHGMYKDEEIRKYLSNKLSFDVWGDLMAFTGLSEDELMKRLRREGIHHFSVEHNFFSPRSAAELAMFYRSSTAYVWGNSLHPAIDMSKLNLTAEDGPVLEYSGGVGSNVLALASNGIKAVYFGIGMMEYEFAYFRVQRHGLGHMVEFVRPYRNSSENGWHFDPFQSLKLGTSIREPLGGIFALDVFEHIPDYHITARHLISLLRESGRLFENSPFSTRAKTDTSIHLQASMPLEDAFTGMQFVETVTSTNPSMNVWEKTSRR